MARFFNAPESLKHGTDTNIKNHTTASPDDTRTGINTRPTNVPDLTAKTLWERNFCANGIIRQRLGLILIFWTCLNWRKTSTKAQSNVGPALAGNQNQTMARI